MTSVVAVLVLGHLRYQKPAFLTLVPYSGAGIEVRHFCFEDYGCITRL